MKDFGAANPLQHTNGRNVETVGQGFTVTHGTVMTMIVILGRVHPRRGHEFDR